VLLLVVHGLHGTRSAGKCCKWFGSGASSFQPVSSLPIFFVSSLFRANVSHVYVQRTVQKAGIERCWAPKELILLPSITKARLLSLLVKNKVGLKKDVQ